METDGRRIMAARAIAVIADAVQLGLLPLFVQGALSTVNMVLDVVVAAVLIRLVGWHWTFLPAFVAEVIPFVDLAPTWTAAIIIATRSSDAAVPPPPPTQPLQPGPKPPPPS